LTKTVKALLSVSALNLFYIYIDNIIHFIDPLVFTLIKFRKYLNSI